MRRRHAIEPRRIVFIGCEGKSEQAFARFLERCCEAEGLHLHLQTAVGGQSDRAFHSIRPVAAARHDDQLRRLLDVLGLRPSRGESR